MPSQLQSTAPADFAPRSFEKTVWPLASTRLSVTSFASAGSVIRPAKAPLESGVAMSDATSAPRPIHPEASPKRDAARSLAMPFSEVFISVMPATLENCAICAAIWLLSTGAVGSCVFSCAVSSFRKPA